MKSIRIDDEVWQAIKSQAEPLEDTPNSVLRRVLRLSSPEVGSGTQETQTERASPNRLLPKSEYTAPILAALVELGGQAKAADIMSRLEHALADKLTDRDLEETPRAGIRWKTKVRSYRYDLIRQGLLARNSPFGYWTITEQGRAWLKRNK